MENEEHTDSSHIPPPPSSRFLLSSVLSAFIGALVCAGGVGAYMMWFAPPTQKAPEEEKKTGPLVPPAYFFEIPDIIVNLQATEKGKRNFLKLKLVLEVGEPTDLLMLDKIKPRLMDQMQTYLRELKITDLDGTQGAMKLKENVLLRIQTVSDPVVIKNILFKDFLVQ